MEALAFTYIAFGFFFILRFLVRQFRKSRKENIRSNLKTTLIPKFKEQILN